MGGIVGLDWVQVQSVLRMQRIPSRDWPELMDQLAVAEDVVLESLARRQ